MASPWIRVATNLSSHAKLGRLTTALKLPEYTAIGVITSVWLWAKAHRPDGNLTGVDPHDLAWAIRWDQDPQTLFDALNQAGFLTDGQLIGWDEYQVTPEQTAEKRAAAGRWGAHRRHHEGKGITDPACEFCGQEAASKPLDTQQDPTRNPIGTQVGSDRYLLGTQCQPIRELEGTQQDPSSNPIGTQKEPNSSPTNTQPNQPPETTETSDNGKQLGADRCPIGTQVATHLGSDRYPLAKLATETETETETIHTPLKPPPGGEDQPNPKPAKKLKPKTATLTPDEEAAFETWWESYPRRDGKRLGKSETRAEWTRLTPAERERATIGVTHYAASDHGQFYAKDPIRFLRKNRHGTRYFDEWQTPAEHQPKPTNGKPTGIDWQAIEANNANEAYWFLDAPNKANG